MVPEVSVYGLLFWPCGKASEHLEVEEHDGGS
jgi:hypothetical protein